jgi:hypothetical protein
MELMRNSTPEVTLGTYAQTVGNEKRDAGEKVALLVLDGGKGSLACPNCVHLAVLLLIVSRFCNYVIDSLVELSGIEPLTSSLRTRRSPN